MGVQYAELVGNYTYLPISGMLALLSMLVAIQAIRDRQLRLDVIGLVVYATTGFVAETIWLIYEIHFHIEPFPSPADFFYLIGYPFLLMFLLERIGLVKTALTNKMIAASSVTAVLLITAILGLYYFTEHNPENGSIDILISLIYPIFDVIVLAPAILGVFLFIKKYITLKESLFFVAVLSMFVGDTMFLFLQDSDEYYTGNPTELFFYYNYILLMISTYYQLFRAPNTSSSKSV
jgi:hypothetical protein